MLERVLFAAAWSPSGSNLQPWNSYVLTGAPLAELKKLAAERVAAGDTWNSGNTRCTRRRVNGPSVADHIADSHE